MAWSDSAAPKFNYPDRKLRNLVGVKIEIDITDVGIIFSIKKPGEPETAEWSEFVYAQGKVAKNSPFTGEQLAAIEADFQPLVDALFAANSVIGADS